ncbi:Putative 115 kDa protein in type-1 retrotransposable element R1DM [Eumeta japonica]|uniref:115 kDa protein in type-1 retrotransposable element R1DM n=1 Tax=Eumeta variegata TaxID=151549 RepID=A0A4C1UBA2_EUMVA|nr:Putative 115 kDa protein in type-1 retrotransposable element R1DM [Eumeta japonica]
MAPSRRKYVVGDMCRLGRFTRAVAEADHELETVLLCTGWESLWDGIYRVIRETENREDVDYDDPYHTEVRRRTDGSSQPPEAPGDLPGVDPPFTGAEVRFALKAFHPRKDPGIDGFTSDICQAAIFRDLGLFLAMANKCLELGYFPRAWKVAAIKVIPKPGKEDYARPKSYRPIGLLPVLGKTVERMLVGRLQWHSMPKLQATQNGFTPQRGTEDTLKI